MTSILSPATGSIGSWQAPQADLAHALAAPALAALDELGVIEAGGADATAFLQAQLTNDTAGLDAERVQLNGYCTPKGRLLAVFDQWRNGSTICLQLPSEILAPVMSRLAKFVLRAKVTLENASAQWASFGLAGPGSERLIAAAFGGAPATGQTRLVDGVRITRLPEGARARERFALRVAAGRADALRRALAQAHPVASGVWWWSQIDAAQPTVVAATQEAFVPQMINLEVLGGVSFKKGCYPGQEVVARSQYLGKLRRRMSLAHLDVGTAAAGGNVHAPAQEEPVGKIVLAAAAPGGGTDLLFECPVDRLDGALSVGSRPLALRPLPYALIDVTA